MIRLCVLTILAGLVGAAVPGAADESGDAARGKAIFNERCAVCHGRDGRGDRAMAQTPDTRAVDLTGAEVRRKSDADLVTLIQAGKPRSKMPAFEGHLSKTAIRHVVAYVRTLPTPAAEAAGGSGAAPASGFALLPRLPELTEAPTGKKGEAVRYGYELVVNTRAHLVTYVGNALSCRNCHLDAGRRPHAAPFVGVYAAYPLFRSRNAMVNTLERRINDCFERSLNGRPLPYDSREMAALVSYMAWLSEGIPVGTILPERGIPRLRASRAPDPQRGKTLFAGACAACHGAGGQGTNSAPPVWGPRSFNSGSGMARVDIAAAFIRQNMPPTRPGSLTVDDAFDLAAYVTSQPRPAFVRAARDYPQGRDPDEPF